MIVFFLAIHYAACQMTLVDDVFCSESPVKGRLMSNFCESHSLVGDFPCDLAVIAAIFLDCCNQLVGLLPNL